ncbi:MAG: YdjY domain-containing protein [Planctomycetota bacterium]
MKTPCLVGLTLALALGASAAGGATAKPELPNLRLDLKAKTVEIDGKFCIGEYPLELLVCQKQLRDYEAMISSPCQPSVLHTALLALGLKPRVRDKKDPGKILREGDPVDIRVRFERDGKTVTVEPRELIIDLKTKKNLDATPWVFYGSFLFPDPNNKQRMIYLGDSEQWLIGLLGDTPSVIDLHPDHVGTYGNLAIDLEAAPGQGAKATLIIRPGKTHKKQGAEANADSGQ